MMGNDMSLEREHSVFVRVCAYVSWIHDHIAVHTLINRANSSHLAERVLIYAPITIYIYCTYMSQLASLYISSFLSLSIHLSSSPTLSFCPFRLCPPAFFHLSSCIFLPRRLSVFFSSAISFSFLSQPP